MSDVFLGQLMLAGFDFAPQGWAQCAGQIMPISSNTALFSLLGVYYGGNGTSNFMLPNLQGACAVGAGQVVGLSSYELGQSGGSPTVTLTASEVPPHTHPFQAQKFLSNATTPTSNAFADSRPGDLYTNAASPHTVPLTSVTNAVGGGQAHNNMMPYLALNWVIALQGIYPPRS